MDTLSVSEFEKFVKKFKENLSAQNPSLYNEVTFSSLPRDFRYYIMYFDLHDVIEDYSSLSVEKKAELITVYYQTMPRLEFNS